MRVVLFCFIGYYFLGLLVIVKVLIFWKIVNGEIVYFICILKYNFFFVEIMW